MAAAEPIRDAVREVFWTQLYAEGAKDPQKRQALFFGERGNPLPGRARARGVRRP